MLNSLILLLILTPLSAIAARSMASVRNEIRIFHARELMGRGYKKSVVAKVEKTAGLEDRIFATVKERLPKGHKDQAKIITNAIIEEASLNNLDPFFVMAVICGESSFNPLAIGPVGEIGLMQIRPTTGEWMAKIIKVKWDGDMSLKDPSMNIKLGTAYLAWLRKKFEGHGQLYLAAYNMGAKSVKNAVERNVMPKDYPMHVMKRYVAFYRNINVGL